MTHSYRTIELPVQGVYKEKGSRFLAFGYPVADEAAIRACLEKLKKEYHDARHYCFAWVLGPEGTRFRAFDDGEPGHSAGDPILGALRHHDLTDVLLVVVRYFGGVKLGVGNLAGAYKAAAREALQHAVIIEKEVKEYLVFKFPYGSTAEVMKLVKDYNMEITDQQFQDDCRMKVSVGLKEKESLMKKIALLQALKVDLEVS